MSTHVHSEGSSTGQLPGGRGPHPALRLLYLLGGPLIWLGSLLLLALARMGGCAPLSLVLVIQFAALAGCVVLMYQALRNVRRRVPGRPERERLRHFAAGGSAVLGMGLIGATAFSASLAGC